MNMTEKSMRIATPPVAQNEAGEIRRVGVEVEFAGLSSEQAASMVQKSFGGNIKGGDTPFVFSVVDTRWGDFRIELDTRVVHPEKDLGDVLEEGPLPVSEDGTEVVRAVDGQVREWIGKASAGVVPTEIVSPPIPWDELGDLTPLLEALRLGGAKGTDESFAYSFGVHLNPEVARQDVGYLLAVLRAYVLLSDWLRAQIDVNPTRKILPHIDPFPGEYAAQILAVDYDPDLATLIRDYFALNPTRNRELDMLPVFCHLDAETLASLTDDERIKGRPTFHYRLPDANLSDADWTIVEDWNRWVVVERLAADAENLRRLADDHLKHANRPAVDRLKDISPWIENLVNP